jgi:hypothetical protein
MKAAPTWEACSSALFFDSEEKRNNPLVSWAKFGGCKTGFFKEKRQLSFLIVAGIHHLTGWQRRAEGNR